MKILKERPLGSRSRGFSVLGWLLMIPMAIVALLILVFGFYEGRKAYWDSEVKAMCEKEGGIQVYERVVIPARYLDRDGNIKIPTANTDPTRKPFSWEAKPDDLFYYTRDHKTIVSGRLVVGRDEVTIVRRVDKKILGKAVTFGRGGGDFPTYAHPSSFRCPRHQDLEEAVFAKPHPGNR